MFWDINPKITNVFGISFSSQKTYEIWDVLTWSFFCVDRRRRRRSFVLLNIEARRMSSAMTEDLEELDYMKEREGRDVGGRE